jgi:hypothetical protein
LKGLGNWEKKFIISMLQNCQQNKYEFLVTTLRNKIKVYEVLDYSNAKVPRIVHIEQ